MDSLCFPLPRRLCPLRYAQEDEGPVEEDGSLAFDEGRIQAIRSGMFLFLDDVVPSRVGVV